MPDTPTTVFISYARTNTDFVDHLEADLQMRGLHTWVDRRKLEGGQDWLDSIQQAIERCQVLLVILSPDAVESKYVRMEYRHALGMGKPVIPLQYRLCPKVPIDLNGIQWIDFIKPYDDGLSKLLVVLSRIENTEPEMQKASLPPVQSQAFLTSQEKEPDLVTPQPAPPPPEPVLDDLYRTGVKAMSEGDLERAVVLWQQILDRDPDFKSGTFVAQREKLLKKLYPFRIQRLRERAEEASKVGEWGQEISMWEALLTLEPDDPQAQRRIALAKENQKYSWHYENALQFAQEDLLPLAQTELEMLWDAAPYYGDPSQLAEKIGIKVKISCPADFDKSEMERAAREEEAAKVRKQREESIAKVQEAAKVRKQREEQEAKIQEAAKFRKQREEQEAKIRELEEKRKTISGFVELELETVPVVTWIALLCLLSGIGSAVGMLVQPWYWSVGTVGAVMILAYGLGYRRAIHPLIMLAIAAIGCIIAFGLAKYAATFSAPSQTSGLWLIGQRILWDGRQVDFGLLIGAASSISSFIYIYEDEDDFGVGFLASMILGPFFGLIAWAILALIASIFGWGFGFGAGWYISLIGLVVGIIGGVGLGALFAVCVEAFDL